MSSPKDEVVDFRFGQELRRLRRAKGLSLGDLSDLVHYSKGHLSKIENGRVLPIVPLARACDSVLSADGRLIALAATDKRADVPAGVAPDAPWSLRLNPDGSGIVEIGGSSGPPVTIISTMAGFSSDPLPGFVAVFEEIRRLGRTASPSMVLPMAVTQVHVVVSAARHSSHRIRADLLRHAARVAEFAGWMAQEGGDDRGALWWTGRAVELATVAGDECMADYALVRRAVLSLYQFDSSSAIAAAEHVLGKTATCPRIRWLAALGAAQGYALGSDEAKVMRALAQAAELWEPALGSDVDAHLGPSSVQGRATLIEAWCHYDLGNLGTAAKFFDTGMSQAPGQSDRDRARFGTRQALVHAALGDPQRACELIEPLFEVIRAVDSMTIRSDLVDFARTIRRFPDHPLLHRIEPALRDSLARR